MKQLGTNIFGIFDIGLADQIKRLSPAVVAFIGAALMIGASIMTYSAQDAGEMRYCEILGERSALGSGQDTEYERCLEELYDKIRLADLTSSIGYAILLFSIALAIINRKQDKPDEEA